MNKRLSFLDTVRFLACTLVFVNHFCVNVGGGKFSFLWESIPYRYLFAGLNGKFGVSMFAVVSGYLATLCGKKHSFLGYTIKRYLSFVFAEIVAVLFLLFCRIVTQQSPISDYSLYAIIKDCLSLGSVVVPILWCFREFLLGSVFCFICGKYKLDFFPILAIIFILALVGKIWTAVCVFGALAYCITQSKRFHIFFNIHSLFPFCLFVFGFLIAIVAPIKHRYYHFMIGIASFFIICAVLFKESWQDSLTAKNIFWSSIFKRYFAFYIVNEQIYTYMGNQLCSLFRFLPESIAFIFSLLICYILVLLISVPVDFLIHHFNQITESLIKATHLNEIEEKMVV